MWRRSASFILDKQGQLRNDTVANENRPLSPGSTAITAGNPNPNVSMYYQTRAAHHGVVTNDWLAQAEAAVIGHSDDSVSENNVSGDEEESKGLTVVDEFNKWRKQSELAEAVAAIRALAWVIRSSQATTMMELEIELKKAADSLKVLNCLIFWELILSSYIFCA